jgi:hypothetical protein
LGDGLGDAAGDAVTTTLSRPITFEYVFSTCETAMLDNLASS